MGMKKKGVESDCESCKIDDGVWDLIVFLKKWN